MAKPIQGYAYTVTGTNDFPFDMLRYDRCWPRYESEIGDFAPYYRGATRKAERTIHMIGLNEPTDGRWSSFGWKVSGFDRTTLNV